MTCLVGIANITPDSFSDGGRYEVADAAIAHIESLIADGAGMIDIGAESTRPGATPLSEQEEWARLKPLFALLTPTLIQRAIFSLDTRHPANVKRALDHGFHVINDVSGLTNKDMIYTLMGYNTQLVMMHSLTIPADKSVTLPEACDVIHELQSYAHKQLALLEEAGIHKERLIFDPGLGFGKTSAQSWEIINRIDELKTLGMPLYVGHSRKSFLAERGDRDDMTLAISRQLIEKNIDYLRVHDIAAHAPLLEGR